MEIILGQSVWQNSKGEVDGFTSEIDLVVTPYKLTGSIVSPKTVFVTPKIREINFNRFFHCE